MPWTSYNRPDEVGATGNELTESTDMKSEHIDKGHTWIKTISTLNYRKHFKI